jgi:Tfp pilus assembly protein PilF
MNLLLAASVWLTLAGHPQATLQINVDSKTGDTISGEKDFKVTVDSPDSTPINQVEFYVGDALEDTETSTPYIFPFDTIDQPDGDVTVKFKAYSTQNKTVEKTLTLHIDNQKSQGAPFHVKAGQADLTDEKYKEAISEGRIALKLDSSSEGAKIVLARANLGLKVYDRAEKYAEDAVSQDAKNMPALDVLADIDIHRAFSTFSKSGTDQSDVVATIGDAFKAAVDARRELLNLQVDALGAPTDATLIKVADAANQAERYSLTISTLLLKSQNDPQNTKFTDRLAYAQLRSGRYQDALNTLTLAGSQGKMDAYGDALLALTDLQIGKPHESEIAIKNGIEDDPDNLGVRTAQAFIALKQNKTSVLEGLATDLARDQGQRASVNYFLMALDNRLQKYSEARKAFERAALTEPCYPDLYIEQANNGLADAFGQAQDATARDRSLSLAKMYYQVALTARPEAADALAGLTTVYLLQKQIPDAVKYAAAAVAAAPDSATGHYALAAAYQASGRFNEAQVENAKAAQLDPTGLQGRPLPAPLDLWRYLVTSGRIPVISEPPQA